MDIRVDKHSDVPLHEQISAQLVLQIGTGALKAGTLLPSVRALALRLRVHRNTVSRAYHDTTLSWLVGKRTGARLVVLAPEPEASPDAGDLDALLTAMVTEARRKGYSLRSIHDLLLSRLLIAPPDRILVVAEDAGMRRLLPSELADHLQVRVDACTPEELESAPQRALGAIVVSPQGYVRRVRAVLTAGHQVIAITYASAEPHLRVVRELAGPSLVAVISVSAYFLEMARAVLAPVVGRRHSLHCHLATRKRLDVPREADVIVCDTLTYPTIRALYRAPVVLAHRLIAQGCLDKVSRGFSDKGTAS